MDLKTINRIASQEVKAHSIKEGTVLLRNVVRIVGISVTIQGQQTPMEPPSNRYTAFLDYPNLGKGMSKLITEGHTVMAKIKLVKGRWDVISLEVMEDEPEDNEDWGDPSEDY